MPEKDKEKILTKNFVMLLLSFLLGFICLTMFVFFMPLYLVSIGGNEVSVGITTGVFTLSSIILRPVLGRYIDQYGCKKVLLLGMWIYCATSFMYIWAPGLFFIYLLRAVQGVGWGAFFISAYTMVAELAPENRRGEALGFFTSAPPIGMAVGPLVGEYISLNFGFFTFLLVSGLISSLALVFTIFIKEKVVRVVKVVKVNRSAPAFLISRAVLFPSAIIFIINVAMGSVISFLPLMSQARNITHTGMFFMVYGIIILLTRPLGGKFVDRFGYRLIVLPSLVSLCLSMVLLAFSTSLLFVILSAILFGLGFSLSFPALMNFCIELSPENERGRAMSTFTSAIDLGIGLGSMGIGFILYYTGFTTIYLACAVMLLSGFILLFKNRPEVKEIENKEAV